jgi:glycosyltransferase involved in cell wall biosynthesis
MRVLMVSKACVVGAYQRKLEEIARYEDVSLTVVVPPAWHEAGRTLKLERAYTSGYELVVEPMLLNGRFHLHFYPGLAQRLQQVQADIVHIDEEPYNLATLQATYLAERAGLATLFFTWQNIHRRYPPPFSWMENYVLRRADAAIAGNKAAADVITAKGYRGPIDVIPQFGVDPELYCPAAQVKRSPRDAFRIGYAGRLVDAKGVHVLIDAATGLQGNWRLEILGSGPAETELQQRADAAGIAGRVRFHPPRPSCRMPEFLNQLDALVLPSQTQSNWKEQFGRVLIEAMACQVAVVGSTSGEIPNVIGDAGLLFPEGDVARLRDQLQRLIDDTELQSTLAQAGRARVLQHFTQTEIARRTVAVYRALMATRHEA